MVSPAGTGGLVDLFPDVGHLPGWGYEVRKAEGGAPRVRRNAAQNALAVE